MTNTKFGLFRHGQTDWNINFLLQGVTDIPMNETGHHQVSQAAKVLLREDWDVLISSPLTRAQQTAGIIAKELGFDAVNIEPLLLERSFGEAEGLSHEQWRAKFANLDEIPGGESREQLHARSELLLETVRDNYPGQRVLAVSHGALIRSVIAISSNHELPRDGERLSNASLNVVKHLSSGWKVTHYQLESLS